MIIRYYTKHFWDSNGPAGYKIYASHPKIAAFSPHMR